MTRPHFNLVKTFSASKQRERDTLGDAVTNWLHGDGKHFTVVDREVTQSSDNEFHCLTIHHAVLQGGAGMNDRQEDATPRRFEARMEEFRQAWSLWMSGHSTDRELSEAICSVFSDWDAASNSIEAPTRDLNLQVRESKVHGPTWEIHDGAQCIDTGSAETMYAARRDGEARLRVLKRPRNETPSPQEALSVSDDYYTGCKTVHRGPHPYRRLRFMKVAGTLVAEKYVGQEIWESVQTEEEIFETLAAVFNEGPRSTRSAHDEDSSR